MSDDVKTPEEVAAQDELNASVTISFGSKDEVSKGGFLPLDEDIYLMTVAKAEVRERPNWDDKTILEKVIMLEFDVDSTKGGGAIVDLDGKEQANGTRKHWAWLNPQATGFRGDGKPSKFRECICALLKQDVNDQLQGLAVDDLVGKSAYIMLEVEAEKDGSKTNKSVKFSKV